VRSSWPSSAVVVVVALSLVPAPSFAQQRATPNPVQFAPPIVYGNPIPYATGIASGDLTGNGISDLIVVGPDDGLAEVRLGRADGTFKHWVYSSAGQFPSVVTVGKFDGKNLDAVINDGADAWVLLGGGGGGFPRATWLDAGGNFVVGFAVGDFNGDGKQDIAALVDIPGQNYSNSSEVYLYLGNGDGTFQSARVLSAGNQVPTAILAGDFNGDGKLDLAVLCTHQSDFAGQVVVLLGDGSGGFGAPIHFWFRNNPPYLLHAMTLGDFNHDNKLDLAVAYRNWDSGSGFVRILLGNGDGTFRRGVLARSGKGDTSIASADFNGDGIPDLVVSDIYCPTKDGHFHCISVLLGNGDGTFQPPANFREGSGAGQLTVADFNGDGKPDVAAVNIYSVSVLLNTTQFSTRRAKPARGQRH
jgi:hypothetical protein